MVSWAGIGGSPGWMVMGIGVSGFWGGATGLAVLVLGSDAWEEGLEGMYVCGCPEASGVNDAVSSAA